MDFDFEAFVKERDAALLSLNKEKILAYCNKYGVPVPKDEKILWAGVHKSILHINDATEEQKKISKVWLKRNGFKEEVR